MIIYTKTGDHGTTLNYKNETLDKDSRYCNIIGEIDELNARLGGIGHIKIFNDKDISIELNNFINDIYDINKNICSFISKCIVYFDIKFITKLEQQIDIIKKLIPETNSFMLFNTYNSYILNMARTQSRKVERIFIGYTKYQSIDTDNENFIFKYLNRLSDFLYIYCLYYFYFDTKLLNNIELNLQHNPTYLYLSTLKKSNNTNTNINTNTNTEDINTTDINTEDINSDADDTNNSGTNDIHTNTNIENINSDIDDTDDTDNNGTDDINYNNKNTNFFKNWFSIFNRSGSFIN